MEGDAVQDAAVTVRTDLLCLGGASLDILLRAPSVPAQDEKMVATYVGCQPGGAVANVTCAAARLGLRTAWAGRLGGDPAGQAMLQGFEETGVDTGLIEIDARARTAFCVVLLHPSAERTILVVPGVGSDVDLDGPRAEAPGRARIVYSMPFEPERFARLAETAHRSGGLVALTLEGSTSLRGTSLERCLREADLLFCSRAGLSLVGGPSGAGEAAKRLLAMGPECVCITAGERGAKAYTQQGCFEQPAYAVDAVDTTGAGDCFHAAFLAAYLEEAPPDKALRFAAAAAALSTLKTGARAGFPTRDQVERFLNERAHVRGVHSQEGDPPGGAATG
jgi:sugar/nucleoside kinase (ribokinase family)